VASGRSSPELEVSQRWNAWRRAARVPTAIEDRGSRRRSRIEEDRGGLRRIEEEEDRG